MTGHVLIFYHSASGNTQWVAGKLAASLPGCGIETEVRSIASRPRTDDLDSYDLIGFGCPVMGFRPSFAMTRFIQSLPPQAQKPAFLFTTCAGVLANTPWMLDGYLSVRGFVVLADQHFRGEVSWPIARAAGLIINRGLPNHTMLPSISRFAGTLAELAERHKAGVLSRPAPFARSRINPFYYLSLLNSPARLRMMMGKKSINTTRCTMCGQCAERCAAGAISLAPYPTFSNSCDGCWGCFNVCPTGAISTIVGTRGRYTSKCTPHTFTQIRDDQ
jgi:ferredoxin